MGLILWFGSSLHHASIYCRRPFYHSLHCKKLVELPRPAELRVSSPIQSAVVCISLEYDIVVLLFICSCLQDFVAACHLSFEIHHIKDEGVRCQRNSLFLLCQILV